jgi:hypothetical protein
MVNPIDFRSSMCDPTFTESPSESVHSSLLIDNSTKGIYDHDLARYVYSPQAKSDSLASTDSMSLPEVFLAVICLTPLQFTPKNLLT